MFCEVYLFFKFALCFYQNAFVCSRNVEMKKRKKNMQGSRICKKSSAFYHKGFSPNVFEEKKHRKRKT
jgi:hypothetical protein